MESAIAGFIFEPIRKMLSNGIENDAPWRREVLKSIIAGNVEFFVDRSIINKERQKLERVSKGTSTDNCQTDSDQSKESVNHLESTTSSESYKELVKQPKEIRTEELRNLRSNEEEEELKRYINNLIERCDTLAMVNEDLTKEIKKEKYLRQESDVSYDMLKEEFVRITSALKEIHLKEFENIHNVHEQDVYNIENKLRKEFDCSIDKMKFQHQMEVETLVKQHNEQNQMELETLKDIIEIQNMESIRHEELKNMEKKLKAVFESSLENIKSQYEFKVKTLEETYRNEIEHFKISKQKEFVENPYSISCSKKPMINNCEAEIDLLTKELKELKTEIRIEKEKNNLVSSEMLDEFIGMCCKQFRLTDDLKRQSIIINGNEQQSLAMKFDQEKSEFENEIKHLQEGKQILANEIHKMEVRLQEETQMLRNEIREMEVTLRAKEENFTQEILYREAKEHEFNDLIKLKNVTIKNCLEEKQENISKLNKKLDDYKNKSSSIQKENVTLKVELMIVEKLLNEAMTNFMLEIGRNKRHSTELRENMNKIKNFRNQQVHFDKDVSDLTETKLALMNELHEFRGTLNNVKSEKLLNESIFIDERKSIQEELEKERSNSLYLQQTLGELYSDSQEELVKQRENYDKQLTVLQENLDMLRIKEEDERMKTEKLVSEMEILMNKLEKVYSESENYKRQLTCSNAELKSEKSKTANLKSQLEIITNEESENLKLQLGKFNNKVHIERRKLNKNKAQLESVKNELTRERNNSETLLLQMERLKYELEVERIKCVELQSLWQRSKNGLEIELRNRAELELRLEDLQEELEQEQFEYINVKTQLKIMENEELPCVQEEFSKLKKDFLEEKLRLNANIRTQKDKIELKDIKISKLKKENGSLTLHCQNLKQELDLIVNDKKDVDSTWDGLNAQVKRLMADLVLVESSSRHVGSGDGFNKTINKRGNAMRLKCLEIEQANKECKDDEVVQCRFEQPVQNKMGLVQPQAESQLVQNKMGLVQPQAESQLVQNKMGLVQTQAESQLVQKRMGLVQPQAMSTKHDLKSSLSQETNSRCNSSNRSVLLSPIREMIEIGFSPDRR